jgi:hypothetical protein
MRPVALSVAGCAWLLTLAACAFLHAALIARSKYPLLMAKDVL